MTTKAKAQANEQAAELARTDEAQAETPRCGAPHHLAMLAHLACAEPAGHDDPQGPDQGERRHRVRHDGTLYVWE